MRPPTTAALFFAILSVGVDGWPQIVLACVGGLFLLSSAYVPRDRYPSTVKARLEAREARRRENLRRRFG